MDDENNDLDIGMLLADPRDRSEAYARWSTQLAEYVQQQGSLDALRLRPITEPPWPREDNPMLCYLVDRAVEIIDHDGSDAAITWLARQAWLEATIAERSRVAFLLADDC
jgi:hypothetical protein